MKVFNNLNCFKKNSFSLNTFQSFITPKALNKSKISSKYFSNTFNKNHFSKFTSFSLKYFNFNNIQRNFFTTSSTPPTEQLKENVFTINDEEQLKKI